MDWRAVLRSLTSLFTKTKVNNADAIGAGDVAPETNKNDEVVKPAAQGGCPGAAPAGRDDGADAPVVVVVAPEEVMIDVPSSTSSTEMAAEATTEKDNNRAGEAPEQERRMRQHTLQATTSDSRTTPWLFRHLFRDFRRRQSNAGSAVREELSRLSVVRSWIDGETGPEARSTSSKRRQRLHDLLKKTILLKFVLLVALVAYGPSYSSNAWFMMSLQSCILAFLVDILSAVMLINLTATVPVRWHCYLAFFSGVSMTLVPYFLLVSMDKLSAYVVVLAVPLPIAVVALVNCVWPPGQAVNDDDLDHVFDVSSAATNVAAGGGLTGTVFGYSMSSPHPTTAGPLGFLLFFAIILGVYLMLVATVRPKALTRHAGRLMYILLALLAATAVVAAVEFVGWWLACAVASIDVIEAAVSTVLAKVHGGVARATTSGDEEDASGARKKDQRLTSIVIATVLFTLVMQLHSQKAGDGLGQYEVLRMLLYWAAFLWSFNRMLFFHEELAAGAGDGGGGAGVWAWLWSAVQLVRSTVVVLAVLDHVAFSSSAN